MADPIRSFAARPFSGTALHDHVQFVTHRLDDETFQGTWSIARESEIVFADHNRDGNAFTHHGGTISGAPGGTPVQIIFWGTWWNTPAGSARRAELEGSVQTLLGLPYWSGLTQYGIPHAPNWRGSTTVITPAPPPNGDTATRAVLDLIDDLIDTDVVPDPDEGRIAIIAFMPQGFVETTAQGAHSADYDYDFPFDEDVYWGGWVAFKNTVDDAMWVFSHELTEMLTDPERDAWHTERDTSSNELSDAGGSPWAGETPFSLRRTDQTAFTGGVRVQSYFSNLHGVPIIPIEPGYRAQLTALVQERDRRETAEGTFRPKALAGICVEDRDYWWRTYEVEQSITVTLSSHGYHAAAVGVDPARAWTLNGQHVPLGTSSITLSVNVDTHVGRSLVLQPSNVIIDCTATATRLDLDLHQPRGSFDLQIGATVVDTEITGNIRSQPTSRPLVTVGVTGSVLTEEPAYHEQFERCVDVLTKRYIEQVRPGGRPRPGDPPHLDFGSLTQDLPAHVTPSAFAKILLAKKAVRAIRATDAGGGARLAHQFIEDIPELARYVGFERVDAALDSPMDATWGDGEAH